MAELRIIAGPSAGATYKIGLGITSIGREQTNSIQVDDVEVSRRHAELHGRTGEFVLVDLSSSNGTFVNGEPITTRTLRPGERFLVGQSVFEFQESSAKPAREILQRDATSVSDNPPENVVDSDDQLLKTKSNLEVLYHAALAAGLYQVPESLLQRLLELVFCWVSAHRACILIREEGEEGEDRVFAKSIDANSQSGYSSKPFDIEYAVVKYVFDKSEGVVVSNLASDVRFSESANFSKNGERQILCAPIRSRVGTRGVIYADRSNQISDNSDSASALFDDQQLKLLIAIGLHAAVAIENAEHCSMLMQSERDTAVGNAMKSLSHHIKNILQSIYGGNHLIEDGLANQQFSLIQNGWQIVQRNQENLSNLVMDMLAYGTSSTPRLRDIDLNEPISQALQLVERRAEQRHIELRFTPVPETPKVLVEPELIVRALHNILLSSINSCLENSGGTVSIQLLSEAEFGSNQIQIKDDGASMSESEMEALFDPLAISEKSNRIGLGMAVAKKILNEIHATLTASAHPSGGTIYTVEFPNVG